MSKEDVYDYRNKRPPGPGALKLLPPPRPVPAECTAQSAQNILLTRTDH